MFADSLILSIHILLTYFIVLSPFVNNSKYKRNVLLFLIFLYIQFVTKYGKCGLINIEKFFLKEKFKNGFVYRLIKPIICYKLYV